jgi:flagellar motor switch protein FliM
LELTAALGSGSSGRPAPIRVAPPPVKAVTAELARLTLRGEELLGLAPGVVLTLAATPDRAVILRVGDRSGPKGSWSTSRGSSASA